jgi:ribosomal-protein-alanine N-acetyltransferase
MKSKWPIEIKGHEILLRPLRFRDRAKWNQVRVENRDWLSPWEATMPNSGEESYSQLPSFFEMVKILNYEARHGRSFSFAIWHQTQLIGQITLGGVMYGAMRGGHIELKLHRLEINLRPENASSRRVAEKAGYILEGERPRYLHIDGQWRDHITFVSENSAIK